MVYCATQNDTENSRKKIVWTVVTYVKTPENGTTHFWTPMGGVSIALSSPRYEALLLKSGSLRLLMVAMSIMSTSVVFPPE